MTKEELEKEEEYDLIIRFKSNKPKYEIRDYIIKHTLNEFDNLQMWDFKRSSEFVESREKEIKSLGERCLQLQKDKGELTDKVAELEAQIEKMKNCKNCANYMISGKCPSFFRTGWCKNWEMTKGANND